MHRRPLKLGIIGARGHVGAELITLLGHHPGFELAFVSSRELAGRAVAELVTGAPGNLVYETIEAEELGMRAFDACVLALPNGLSPAYVAAVDEHSPEAVIVDISGDHRFAGDWYYGLPELTRGAAAGQRRISNPGCYATAMQLAIAPVKSLLANPPQCFGVSGYSGAGTRPSRRNDPNVLEDNLLPYQPVGHLHEREVSHQLGLTVRFTPHVAQFFRGLGVTVGMTLSRSTDLDEIRSLYRDTFAGEALVRVSDDIPELRENVGRHHATVGGFALAEDGSYLVAFATLDNLLKGAATQALQNLNLACGFDELEGLALG
jgi:N-acetyl-gamma-glutamyl-phosphate reductase